MAWSEFQLFWERFNSPFNLFHHSTGIRSNQNSRHDVHTLKFQAAYWGNRNRDCMNEALTRRHGSTFDISGALQWWVFGEKLTDTSNAKLTGAGYPSLPRSAIFRFPAPG
jgi:hypothetical protein